MVENQENATETSRLNPNSNSTNYNSHTNNNNQNGLSSSINIGRRQSVLFPNSFILSGGVNSLDRFASSFTRAQSFMSVEPSMFGNNNDNDDDENNSYMYDDENSVFEDDASMFSYPFPYNSLPRQFPSEGLSHGAVNINSINHNSIRQTSISSIHGPPLIVKRVERSDGSIIHVIVGQSTAPQTIFNSVNILVGVGLLSMPLALNHAGLLISILFCLAIAFVTSYTAKLLAKCLSTDDSLVTYADIGYAAFGHHSRIVISILFSLELISCGVALVVLFADTIHMLIPSITTTYLKILAFFIFTPLCFVPLNILSFTSILGVLGTFGLIIITFIDGLIKQDRPGSLWSPMPVHFLPKNWLELPLSIGLLMAPWGGHSVFPNIYRDMRHPAKFSKCISIAYTFTFFIDISMGLLGLLMFGDNVKDEITKNILSMNGYPKALHIMMLICISLIPITKTPLNVCPIVTTIDVITGLNKPHEVIGISAFGHFLKKLFIRIFVMFIIIFIAIMFPQFERIMAFMGSSLVFIICTILPPLFYLKIFYGNISLKERVGNYVLIFVSIILAIIGTICAILPDDILKSKIAI